MKTSVKSLFGGLAIGVVALGFAASTPAVWAGPGAGAAAVADKEKQKDKDRKIAEGTQAKVGEKAPDFVLSDTDGKAWRLSDGLKGKKAVVIQWFNPDCPYVVKHYANGQDTFNNLAKEFEAKGVAFVAINSGAPGKEGAGKDRNSKAKTDWKINYPILLDESGDVGRMYGARNTPQMFVIDEAGLVRYAGAIDSNRSANQVGGTNYVKNALDQLLAGKEISEKEQKAYGCSVKYGKK